MRVDTLYTYCDIYIYIYIRSFRLTLINLASKWGGDRTTSLPPSDKVFVAVYAQVCHHRSTTRTTYCSHAELGLNGTSHFNAVFHLPLLVSYHDATQAAREFLLRLRELTAAPNAPAQLIILPRRNPASRLCKPARYSLHQQAELIKRAKAGYALSLSPPAQISY